MDPLARAWNEIYRERISKEVMAAQAVAASMAASAPSTHMFAPAYMLTTTSTSMVVPTPMPPRASTDKVPQVIANEEDVVKVPVDTLPLDHLALKHKLFFWQPDYDE
jgi:hypothetical protein